MISLLPILAAWVTFGHYPNYSYVGNASPQGADMATIAFPQTHYPAFLVCTNANEMNLSNATVVCQFTIEATPDAVFRCGSEGVGNIGPASAHLFFASVTGYADLGTGSTNYYFNRASVTISTNTGTATLIATFDPSQWIDAGGCLDCPPPTDENFWYAAAHIHEIGIALGGQTFWDTGIATTSGDATLHLDYFGVTPKFKGYKQCFSSE